jgi:hypothetical protein
MTTRFELVDAVTGYTREINPVIDAGARLRHTTQATIKRMLTGIRLNAADTAVFNSVSSRLQLYIVIKGEEFKLGRYVPSDWAQLRQTRGNQSVAAFYDEGFIIDQQLPNAFGANLTGGELVDAALARFLDGYPISYLIEEPTEFSTLGSWAAGTRGGQVLDQLALDGDYLSPWFDNDSVLRLRRTFDPADEISAFDFDVSRYVIRDQIIESDNLIYAPNRFVVIGNGVTTFDVPIIATADVPSSAPHSIANRGFIVSDVVTRQLTSSAQANAIARQLAQTQTIFQQAELDTLVDPRHDSYDVVRWRGELWQEIKWAITLADGRMSHTLRRAFT